MKKEFKLLWKHSAQDKDEEDTELQDAVVQKIKKRRKMNVSQEDPITLKEKRALDRANIEAHLKGL